MLMICFNEQEKMSTKAEIVSYSLHIREAEFLIETLAKST